jgi:hypothetical protein
MQLNRAMNSRNIEKPDGNQTDYYRYAGEEEQHILPENLVGLANYI